MSSSFQKRCPLDARMLVQPLDLYSLTWCTQQSSSPRFSWMMILSHPRACLPGSRAGAAWRLTIHLHCCAGAAQSRQLLPRQDSPHLPSNGLQPTITVAVGLGPASQSWAPGHAPSPTGPLAIGPALRPAILYEQQFDGGAQTRTGPSTAATELGTSALAAGQKHTCHLLHCQMCGTNGLPE